MISLSEVNSAEFEIALTPESIRTSQLIYSALMLGVMAFVTAVLLTYNYRDTSQEIHDATDLVNLLSIAHIVMALGAYGAAKFLYDTQFKPEHLASALRRELRDAWGKNIAVSPAEKCVALIRTASIIRLALLEGAAFFGLMTCMVGVTSGVMSSHPEYWLNLVTTAIMTYFTYATFPTRERLLQIFEEKIKGMR